MLTKYQWDFLYRNSDSHTVHTQASNILDWTNEIELSWTTIPIFSSFLEKLYSIQNYFIYYLLARRICSRISESVYVLDVHIREAVARHQSRLRIERRRQEETCIITRTSFIPRLDSFLDGLYSAECRRRTYDFFSQRTWGKVLEQFLKWLNDFVKERPKPRFMYYHEELAQEIIDAANNRGKVVKKKDDIHKLAQANKAYSHNRWGWRWSQNSVGDCIERWRWNDDKVMSMLIETLSEVCQECNYLYWLT